MMDTVVVIDRTIYGLDGMLLTFLQTEILDSVSVSKDADPLRELARVQSPLTAIYVFDYTSSCGLCALRETKRRFPSVPLLMITKQHSEALAVWALRARIWDYFYEPININHFRDALSELRQMKGRSAPGDVRSRVPVDFPQSLPPESKTDDHRSSERLLDTAVSYIKKHYHRRILQTDVAEACGLSTFQFSRAFKEQFGVTFQEYLLGVRIEKACTFLKNPNMSVTEACFNSGFNDPSYFSRAFAKITGRTPSRYRAALSSDRERVATPGGTVERRPESTATRSGPMYIPDLVMEPAGV